MGGGSSTHGTEDEVNVPLRRKQLLVEGKYRAIKKSVYLMITVQKKTTQKYFNP
jgi:hypothetical protein